MRPIGAILPFNSRPGAFAAAPFVFFCAGTRCRRAIGVALAVSTFADSAMLLYALTVASRKLCRPRPLPFVSVETMSSRWSH